MLSPSRKKKHFPPHDFTIRAVPAAFPTTLPRALLLCVSFYTTNAILQVGSHIADRLLKNRIMRTSQQLSVQQFSLRVPWPKGWFRLQPVRAQLVCYF